MMHGEPAGEPRRKQSKEESGEGVNTVLPPSSALVARRAPPRRRAPVKSAPDLFTLKARLQLSDTYQGFLRSPWHVSPPPA